MITGIVKLSVVLTELLNHFVTKIYGLEKVRTSICGVYTLREREVGHAMVML